MGSIFNVSPGLVKTSAEVTRSRTLLVSFLIVIRGSYSPLTLVYLIDVTWYSFIYHQHLCILYLLLPHRRRCRLVLRLYMGVYLYFLGHRDQSIQLPIVITCCTSSVRPSSVCPSSVRHTLDNLHFRLLRNRFVDFDETIYGWSTQGFLQVLLFLGQIRQGADPGRGNIGHSGSP